MPEEIFDSQFATRAIRWLQLRRGRGPAFVGDEIVPVLDLTPLLTRPPEPGYGTVLDAGGFFPSLMGSILYQGYLAPQTVAAGEVGMRQIFNPTGSGKHVIVQQIIGEMVSPSTFLLRRHNTQLATADTIAGMNALKTGSDAVVTIFRKDDQLPASVPPAGAGPILQYRQSSANGIIAPVYLRENEGLLFYPCSNNPATDSDPGGTINQPMTFIVTLLEFTP